MKKILYGTTALLASSLFVSAANAADPMKLQLGGFMNYYGAYIDQDADEYTAAAAARPSLNKFDVIGDGEIYFKGESVLDNGVKVGTVMQLEAGTGDEENVNNDNSTIFDDVYVYGDTAYGRVIAGSTGNVDKMLHVSAIDVGPLDIQASDIGNLIVNRTATTAKVLATNTVTSLDTTYINLDQDANKISYISPTYYGFTAGVTYVPSTSNLQGSDNSVAKGSLDRGYIATLAYSTVYENVGINATAGYGYFTNVDYFTAPTTANISTDQDHYSLGLQLTYQGFTIGSGYKKVEDDLNADPSAVGIAGVGDTPEADGSVWNLGVAYEEGPYGVSVAYMESNVESSTAGVANNVNDEVKTWLVSGKYNLGAGVDTFATIGHRKYDSETVGDEANKGWVAVAGIGLTF